MAGTEIKASQMWSPLENTNASAMAGKNLKALKLVFILLKQDLEFQSYRQP